MSANKLNYTIAKYTIEIPFDLQLPGSKFFTKCVHHQIVREIMNQMVAFTGQREYKNIYCKGKKWETLKELPYKFVELLKNLMFLMDRDIEISAKYLKLIIFVWFKLDVNNTYVKEMNGKYLKKHSTRAFSISNCLRKLFEYYNELGSETDFWDGKIKYDSDELDSDDSDNEDSDDD
jgi:hypothetical protein